MSSLLVNIYRSPVQGEMYLYVAKSDLLARVPEQLLVLFGRPLPVTTMLLTADRKLARARAADVINAIAEKGYYLQMPPVPDDEMQALALKNTRLSRL